MPSTGLVLTFSKVIALNLVGEVLLVVRTPGVGILLTRVVDGVRDEDKRGPRNVGLSGSLESGRGGFIVELRGNGARGGQAKDGELVLIGVWIMSWGSANPISSSCCREKSEPEGVVKTAALLPRRLNGLLNVEDPKRLTRFELSLALAGVSISKSAYWFSE